MDEARITMNAAGAIIDANAEALALYGLGLAELRAAPPGAFSAEPQSDEEQAAFRRDWESSGRPDMVGSATLKRLNGSTVRVRFGITAAPDGTFIAILRPIDEPIEAPPVVYSAGDVLARWRAAERDLEAVAPDAPERSGIEREIERFRDAYQHVFRTAQGKGTGA
jgi:PAS domain-containing protein